MNWISIHALREERDGGIVIHMMKQTYFNPRAPRGARRGAAADYLQFVRISIHALREEIGRAHV